MIDKKRKMYNTLIQDDSNHPVKGEKNKSNPENADILEVNGIFSENARWT